MILVSWNVNSIRARLDRLLAFLARTRPDVVCLQEVKVAEEEFPHDAINGAGYLATVWGQRTYNGVAILAKPVPVTGGPPVSPFVDVVRGFGDGRDDEARLLAATVAGVRIVSAYVPNGKVVGSDKWLHKLDWISRLGTWLPGEAQADRPFVIMGDFNIAPEDRDVAHPEDWKDSVLCHPDGRRALAQALGTEIVDAFRLHDVGPGPFTWWDYRMLGFPKGNGLRIDHMFMTPALAARCHKTWVDRNERKGKLPSDHAPIVAELDLGT